jgi:transposase
MDKAGWHTTKQLRLPQNIIVWFLPPYSPELNPVEMIWKHIRTKYFNNRIFDTLNDVEKQLSRSLKEVFVSIHETKQLTFYKWMQLN